MRAMSIFGAAAFLLAAACSPPAEETPPPAEPAAVTPPPAPAPVTITLTEADARTRIESAGYTNVTALTQNAEGRWTATATQNGQNVNVTIDDAGNVTVATTP